jgi:drug/metabolite transporter (DMT)-like permease
LELIICSPGNAVNAEIAEIAENELTHSAIRDPHSAIERFARRFAICSGRFLQYLYLFWSSSTNDSERQRTTAAMNTKERPWAIAKNRARERTTMSVDASLNELHGWIFTAIGVTCFSLSFVTARLALRGFDPWVVALARGAGAGLVAVVLVGVWRYQPPKRRHIVRLALAALGIVFVFPVFTTMALQTVPASHASTIAAVLPLLTALFGVVRKREKAAIVFWISAAVGTAVVIWFLVSRSNGLHFQDADILILIACVACAFGYAEGGLLAREMGGWLAICWMLVFSAPLAIGLLILYVLWHGGIQPVIAPSAWFGLLYQVAVSQFLGFAFYYRGLALGGVAKMSQVQQFQSMLAVLAAGVILGEHIDAQLWVVLGLLLVTVGLARWSLQARYAPGNAVIAAIADNAVNAKRCERQTPNAKRRTL